MISICGSLKKNMKTDIKEFVDNLKSLINTSLQEDFECCLVAFLNDNEWFGCEPVMAEGKCLVDVDALTQAIPRIIDYFDKKDLPIEEKIILLANKYAEEYPESAGMVDSFFETVGVAEGNQYYLYDYLLTRQKTEFSDMNDESVSELVSYAVYDLTKADGDILCMLLSWLKQYHRMHWFMDYSMKKRRESENGAYDIDEYLELLYYLFNADYIEENDMYKRAANDKNHADTWLYLCMHFMRAIRNTDLLRIGHPRLTDTPENILKMVLEGKFSDEDARLTVYSITWRLSVLPLIPNKTKNVSGVTSLKFTIPESLEVHLGKLLAICESHFRRSGAPVDTPLIRVIGDYERINRYMGDEIGVLFLKSNFRSRGAQKSYLQGVYMMSNDILGDERDEFNVKGYILAALARSHKGSYAQFAQTTVVYLKDAKFSGLTPEFVARELFERGVLSFIPSMLLKIISGNKYNHLSVKEQTKLLDILNITPMEAENAVSLVENSRKKSNEVVKNLFTDKEIKPNEILMILHRIGGGYAVSKCDELLCVMTAMKKICPFDRRSCFGCEYEIGTKSTIFSMAAEYNRLRNIAKTTGSEIERKKSIHLIKSIVLPILQEVLICLRDNYGDDVALAYERIVRENT